MTSRKAPIPKASRVELVWCSGKVTLCLSSWNRGSRWRGMVNKTRYQYGDSTNTSDTHLTEVQLRFWCFISVPLKKLQSQDQVSYFAGESKHAGISPKELLRLMLSIFSNSTDSYFSLPKTEDIRRHPQELLKGNQTLWGLAEVAHS